MLRLGLCCIFREAPIRFRRTTAKALAGLDRPSQLARLNELCMHNARSLLAALQESHRLGFGAFRILSQIFPQSDRHKRLKILERHMVKIGMVI